MMFGNLIIRGGMIASSAGLVRADVRVAHGIIAEIGPSLMPVDKDVIEADGLLVLPGVIDAHSHQWENGLASRPDFRDDTSSAVAGGITTIIDHPLTPPTVLSVDRFSAKVALGERTSFADFALHAGVSSDDLGAMADLWRSGATAFKLFTCDTGIDMKGFLAIDSLRSVFKVLASLGSVGIIHAEDQDVLDSNRRAIEASGQRDVANFGLWRSVEAEFKAITRVLDVARETNAFAYLVHTSIPEGVDAVARARLTGVSAVVETCPHYLYFTEDDIAREGHRVSTSPPVRDTARRAGLRLALRDGISVVGSDHGAVLEARKAPRDVFDGQPGIPGNGMMVALMLNLVSEGVISIERLCKLLAENPARIFGLSSKGFIRQGFDADFTIVDMARLAPVREPALIGSAAWSPYVGLDLTGMVVRTIVRGRTVAIESRPVVDPGYGRFVARTRAPLMP